MGRSEQNNNATSFMTRFVRILCTSSRSALNSDHGAWFSVNTSKDSFWWSMFFCWILQNTVFDNHDTKSFITNVEHNCNWMVWQWWLLLAWFVKVMPVKPRNLQGLATTISIRTKGLITPIVHKCSIYLDHVIHARHEMRILKRQVGLVALHFGSLDYQRPSQVLCQVYAMVGNSKVLYKMSYIKWERPSLRSPFSPALGKKRDDEFEVVVGIRWIEWANAQPSSYSTIARIEAATELIGKTTIVAVGSNLYIYVLRQDLFLNSCIFSASSRLLL